MKKNTVKLNEAQLHRVIKESVKRILRETVETPYGQISANPLKPTFDDEETQCRLKNDMTEMLSNLPTDKFMKYWNMRMKYDDPDMVDAIYNEYYKRHSNGEL